MKVTLTDVSQQRLRKQGILCSSTVIEKDMILLHKIDKDVVLEKHNHPHAQLGYCFYGNFDFEVEGVSHDASKGYSYLLNGEVYHAATAKTDYYSLDIKTMIGSDTMPHQMSSNVFECTENNDKYVLKRAKVGKWLVQNISYIQDVPVNIEIDVNRKNFIFVSEYCALRFEGLLSDLCMEPMKIYQLEVNKPLFSLTSDKEDIEIMIASY
jgi:hypothetical protein